MRIPTALLQLQLVLLCFVSPIQAQTGGFDGNLYTKAEQYFKYGTEVVDRYEKARYMDYSIGLFKEYLDKYPNGANAAGAYYHIGFAEQSLGRIDDAERLYKVVIQRYRKGNSVGLAANKLAWLAFSKEDWANSAKFFATSAANVTNQEVRFSALTKRVECLMKLERDTDVIDALANITTARGHPHMAWAQFMLGYQYYQMEAFEKTIEILKPLTSASTAGTYRAQAMFYAGLASVELGRDDDAQDYLRQVLAVSITNPSLTSEQRKQIAHNKAMAQTGLMSFYFKKEDYSEVAKLFTLGDFGATGRMGELKKVTVTIPEGEHRAGEDIWTRWGPTGYGHGITCVGYDDQVGYDLNGDGKITNDIDTNSDGKVTLADWERGAYIVVNSWGEKWSKDGRVYLLYSAMIDSTWKRGNYLGR
ncbi:hypothetical protein OAG05_03060, partial [Akkermansiaceae bacterium]|nr:hypothetical protein [Akkermansiaceae bacterium]